jgi:hypothetical protein
MSIFLKTIIANLVKMLLGWKMIKFILERLALQTDNKLDDYGVQLIDAMYRGDEEAVKKYLVLIQNEYNSLKGESK